LVSVSNTGNIRKDEFLLDRKVENPHCTVLERMPRSAPDRLQIDPANRSPESIFRWMTANDSDTTLCIMPILTEPIGSIPRPASLMDAILSVQAGKTTAAALDVAYSDALRDTIKRLEQTGSPVITDGEQTKPSFATYPLSGVTNLAPDGVIIPFADGHTRQLPRLTAAPFRYGVHAATFLEAARRYTELPIKQAVISASALSLLYPSEPIPGYSREEFLSDLIDEAEADIRGALEAGAASVQIDFTEARLSLKLDPTGGLLRSFVALNNQVLDRFTAQQRQSIGVHACPGGDHDSTHSADVDYAGLLPDLFQLNVGRFYLQMASEPDRKRVLGIVRQLLRPDHIVFVGVIDPIDPKVETAGEVRDRILEAASILPIAQLGTTDDCGFAPFADDTSTSREIAFSKIRARVEGTELASRILGC
jgi:5-methyltetrahydropteroyltriglutamate--homocysteine methyltransferase